MERQIRNILITNAIALNGGDAAILQATIKILKRRFGQDVKITVHDMAASASARYYPALTFRRDIYSEIVEWSRGHTRAAAAGILVLLATRTWKLPLIGSLLLRSLPATLRRCLSDYAEADIVISSGGTYLVPHYSLTSKLFDFLIAGAHGKPLVLFTQSLGPFPPSRHRFLLRHVLRSATLILVRDARSHAHLDEFGVSPDRVSLCADAAFALAPPDLQGRSFSPTSSSLRIAISVRDWPHFGSRRTDDGMERYFVAMAELARHLIEHYNAEITFISTCQGTPEYWTDDAQTAEEIVRRLPAALHAHAAIDRRFRPPADLITEISTFDLMIATRLHAAILSLCAGTPALPIAYEFKTTELFKRFGLGEAVINIETISPEAMRLAFEKAATFWSTRAPEAWAATRNERDDAFNAANHVARALQRPTYTT